MDERKEKLLLGLNQKKDEYLKLLEKYERLQNERLKQRADTLYTIYGLFLDCLEYPNRTRIEHVDKFICACKGDLEENDLEVLRKVRNLILNDVDVAVKTVFPLSRKISLAAKENNEIEQDIQKAKEISSRSDSILNDSGK